MLETEIGKRCCEAIIAGSLVLAATAFGGEAYYTGFAAFAVGDDKIIGTDGWQGSHAGLGLHGILSEDLHQVAEIGNAAYLGGKSERIPSTNKFVYLRRSVSLDPVALGQEVATFSVMFGIRDSTSTSLYRRDNFEFLVYNKSSQLLGGLQFDNTTLDGKTGTPQRLIYRLAWNGTDFQYYNTGYSYLPQTLEALEYRINFRTNRWTATLGGVPIVQDLEFYSGGTNAKNFGSALVQMKVTNTYPFTSDIHPGDNYMLFDNYAVRTDPVTTTLSISKTNSGAAVLTWNEEAGYSYQVQYSADCLTWKTDLAGSSHAASVTGNATFTDPTQAPPNRRFYRVRRSYP